MGPDDRVQYVRVTNGLDFEFVDRFDGVPVKIPPGKSENLPAEMAAHFFGWHPDAQKASMLRHTAKRHGWNTPDFVLLDPETRKTKAETWFDKIKIEPKVYKLVPDDESDPRKPIPADPEGALAEAPAERKPTPAQAAGPAARFFQAPKRVDVNP